MLGYKFRLYPSKAKLLEHLDMVAEFTDEQVAEIEDYYRRKDGVAG